MQTVKDDKSLVKRKKFDIAFRSGLCIIPLFLKIQTIMIFCKKQYENEILDFSCFAIAVSKGNEVITPEFKSAGSTVILVPMPVVSKTGMPDFDKAKVIYRQIHYLSQNGKVLSASLFSSFAIEADMSS